MKNRTGSLLLQSILVISFSAQIALANTSPSPTPMPTATVTAFPSSSPSSRAEMVLTVTKVKNNLGEYAVKEIWYGRPEAYDSDPSGNSGMTRLSPSAFTATVKNTSSGDSLLYLSLPSWLSSYSAITLVSGFKNSSDLCNDYIPITKQVLTAVAKKQTIQWTVPSPSKSGDCGQKTTTVTLNNETKLEYKSVQPYRSGDYYRFREERHNKIVNYLRGIGVLPQNPNSICENTNCKQSFGNPQNCFVNSLNWEILEKSSKTRKVKITTNCECVFNYPYD